MPHRLVTISYTALDAGGGVPKFNRALRTAFPERECRHFCWDDFPWSSSPDLMGMSEWDRARTLNAYLVGSKSITSDDVVVADGFWAKGLEHLPLAVSHSHGIWSHLTHEDVIAGKQPDMPGHHTAQVLFRKRWRGVLGKRMTAVSYFIADQMRLQWGLDVDRVIDNGVDTELYRPRKRVCSYLNRPLVIHGVNDRSNVNKGFDHIRRLVGFNRQDVMSLDEAHDHFQCFNDQPWTKPEVLAQATIVVHPSGYEGNSLFVLETLACGVPIVAYDVGYLSRFTGRTDFGHVIPLAQRSVDETFRSAISVLLSSSSELAGMGNCARSIAPSLEQFNENWRSYIEEVERDA